MISYEQLLQLEQLPDVLNIPNKDIVLNLIYNQYSNYQTLDDIDKHFSSKTSDLTYYVNSIRPILESLFDLAQPKIIQEQIYDVSSLGFYPDISELYDAKNELILNESQIQVYSIYKKVGLQSGIICHATGTGKTNIIFLTMGLNDNRTIFHFCHYKNILFQSYYDEKGDFDYNKFREIKKYFNIWDYVIYDLTNDNIRNKIISNIDQINKLSHKKIFLINPQYIMKNENRYKQLTNPDLIIHDECHTITGINTYNFLTHFKNMNSVIIGLSATPIRSLKNQHNYNIIKDIYGVDKEINVISSYESITAIIHHAILNIEIFWFESQLNDNAINNRNNKFNIDSCINRIKYVIPLLPNKKILVWCRTIDHAKTIYNNIYNDHDMKQLFNDNIFIDHSQIIDTENQIYINFTKLTGNGIMVCADKYREGSDIKYLDCIVFADLVKKKGELPFIQCIGRVQRKGYNKTVGIVIDHFDTSVEQNKKIKDIIDKLIGYYYEFFSHTKQTTNKLDNAIKMYEDILQRYSFEKSLDKNENIIKIKLTNELSIKIHSGLSDINFDNVKHDFKPIIKEHIEKKFNLETNEILEIEYNEFKKMNDDFYLIEDKYEYKMRIEEFGLEPEPEIKYIKIWKNWYDYLGIDTTKYPSTKEEWLQIIIKNKIKTYDEYKNKASDLGLPLMPEELYNDYENFDIEFKTFKNIKRR